MGVPRGKQVLVAGPCRERNNPAVPGRAASGGGQEPEDIAMRRLLLAALVALGVAMPALAQRGGGGAEPTIQIRPGTYLVQGRDAAGQGYEGMAQLQATGPRTWQVTWRVAGETASGVGLQVGDALVVGYSAGREQGVVIYGQDANGSLTGIWTQGTEGGVGAETLIPR